MRSARAGAVAVAALLGALVLGEGVLRLAGERPWTDLRVRPGEPTLHEPDPVRGWRNRPGSFVLPAYDPESGDVEVTFLADGSRRAEPEPAPADPRPRLLLVGGSFTQGWAISDHETLAWHLQAALPELAVRNHGTGGYGTYQSLLALEEHLAAGDDLALVLYGYLEGHEVRNVAPASWLRHLARYSNRGHVDVPHVTLAPSGSLLRHPPEGHARWPLRRRSALVAGLERAFEDRRTSARAAQATPATDRVLAELQARCDAAGVPLVVALLKASDPTRDRLTRLLEAGGATVVDCTTPLTPELRVPGDGHPNGELNRLWASRLLPELRRLRVVAMPSGGAKPLR